MYMASTHGHGDTWIFQARMRMGLVRGIGGLGGGRGGAGATC